ncbi:lysylphosphatidylglycerol synthase domain-containing protein [Sphingobacterium composti Ten et al. 2007 non Yoo et al. 2007]|uniref:lysylphosphatidylglycerol synthase domain-containing protein n=1 Tax=Sphingobacterium composti TaxID=363260 RepID=UPI001F327A71|nr:lysylphosphatidylglycerol synthase domain-containing protein [Sphingobacterium composti Ten et al. 2007 non Yoo et al. 2007]
MLTKAHKKYFNYGIKLTIVGLAFWFIYSKVNNQKNLLEFKYLIRSIDESILYWTVALVVVLMLFNWIFEVLKWKYIVQDIEKISFWKAFKSVFCGLTWAIFTPNRIGEYGGRILLLKSDNRARGAVLMGVGLFAQLVLTSVFGALGIAWFVSNFLDTPSAVKFGVWVLAAIYGLAFVLLYFNVHWVDYLVGKMKFLKRIQPFFDVLRVVTTAQLGNVLLLSLMRFVIFTSQYIILMAVMLPEINVLPMVMMIFILFFVQSALPTLDIFDFSVRSFVASNLYAYITTQDIAVMAIVSFIWFVNLILPAIIGSVFVLNVNYFGDNNS